MQTNKIKVVLVGDTGVGKTTYVKRMKTGEFERKHTPTMGVEVTPLTFHTNKGVTFVNVWDCAGDEKFRGLGSGYYIGAQVGIVLFDLTRQGTWCNVPQHIQKLRMVDPSMNIIICGNKVDIPNLEVKFSEIKLPEDVTYYHLSTKSNYNFEKPWLSAIRTVLGQDTVFVEEGSEDVPVDA